MSIATTYANTSPDWWTPPEWLDWAHRTLLPEGGDLFDPCPADWDGGVSGLDVQWETPAYINHPGARRGSARKWWRKAIDEQYRHGGRLRMIWCAFNAEQVRHMVPSPYYLPGWLIMPRDRIGFIWGGEDRWDRKGRQTRKHGVRATSPGNWTVFWSTDRPATPPAGCVIHRTL